MARMEELQHEALIINEFLSLALEEASAINKVSEMGATLCSDADDSFISSVIDGAQIQGNEAADGNADQVAQPQVDAEEILRQILTTKIVNLRQCMDGRQRPELKRNAFYVIYETVAQLLGNRHSAAIHKKSESLVIYSSRDGDPWRMVIEPKVANYLDVNGEQFDDIDESSQRRQRRKNGVLCPGILIANVDQNSNLNLTPYKENHTLTTHVVYGIRCRICRSSVKYVGETEETVHVRVCTRHGAEVPKYIDEEFCQQKSARKRPMYEHAAQHFKDLPADTNPRDAFGLIMDVIVLSIVPKPTDIDNDKRLSWECFWMFFFRARIHFEGWSQRCRVYRHSI